MSRSPLRLTARALTVIAGLALLGPVPSLSAEDSRGGASDSGDEGLPEVIGQTFTYQGVLRQSDAPFNGTCDLQFSLWNAAAGPTQIGSTQQFLGLTVTDGLINRDLNFGAGAFDGNDRWIEVAVRVPAGSGSYTTLTPRQKIHAAPYALWALGGAGGGGGLTLPLNSSFQSSTVDGLTVTNLFGGGAGYSGRLGGPGYGVVGKDNVTGNLGYVGHTDYGLFGIAESPVDIGVRGYHGATGNEGQIGGPNEGAFGRHGPSGNYGVLGQSNAGVFAFGNNASALYAQNGSTSNYALLGHADYGVDGVVTSAEDTGVRGYHGPTGNYGRLGTADYGVDGASIGTAISGTNLSSGSLGQLGAPSAAVQGIASFPQYAGIFHGRLFVSGEVPLGILPGCGFQTLSYMNVNTNPSDPLYPFRFIRFQVDNLCAGDIGAYHDGFGWQITYDAFTGTHYGWSAHAVDSGTLVNMTGVNQRAWGNPEAEIEYGIAPAVQPNDPACLGSIAGPRGDRTRNGTREFIPYAVCAVGNGTMWLAESATGNIQPGDYLISSDVPGCAMKDDPQRFPVGYIVARAGEAVDWNAVESPADGTAKRRKISVFFESFVRDSRGSELSRVVEDQAQRIEALESQLRSIQALVENLSQAQAQPSVAKGLMKSAEMPH